MAERHDRRRGEKAEQAARVRPTAPRILLAEVADCVMRYGEKEDADERQNEAAERIVRQPAAERLRARNGP